MTVNNIQPAHNPDLFHTRALTRPLSKQEQFQLALTRCSAIVANNPNPRSFACTGQIYVGMFFDGTGNNENDDYTIPKDNGKPQDEQHSNVVRLFHAHPDRETQGLTP